MRLIPASFRDGTELMNHYVERHPCGALLIDDLPAAKVGERVWLKLQLGSLWETLYVSGRVEFKQASYDRGHKETTAMQIALDDDENLAQQRILAWIKNDLEEFHLRSDERRDVFLTGDIFHGEVKKPIPSTIRNISESGIFADTPTLLPKHTKVQLRLHSSTYGIQRTFLGKVTRIERRDELQGMGIQFLLTSKEERKQLTELLARIARAQAKAAHRGFWAAVSLTNLLKP